MTKECDCLNNLKDEPEEERLGFSAWKCKECEKVYGRVLGRFLKESMEKI